MPTEQKEQLGGNTNSPRLRLRRACFTYNNYKKEHLEHIISQFEKRNWKWVIGLEEGSSGTPHLQGYVNMTKLTEWTVLKKIMPKAHIEKCKGSERSNIKYCTKDGTYRVGGGLTVPLDRRAFLLKKYDGVQWRPWQSKVIENIEQPPDSRSVQWWWEETGNVGKSYLAKYLVLKYNAIIAEGRTSDIANQVNKWLEAHPDSFPSIVIIDLARTSLGNVNYNAIEKLKNGLIYSGKYEGGVCVLDDLHVVVFANSAPNHTQLSMDRWKVNHIFS